MTRHGGGPFPGGGVGGGGSFSNHGRSGGGSFGPPPPPHHHPPPPNRPPPPPPHHRRPLPIYYGPPPPILYSSGARVAGPIYQVPPPVPVDRKTQLLDRAKSFFTFTVIALLIGTIWMYFGPYGSEVIELGVHDSRLLTASPYFVQSIKFNHRYDKDGPLLYMFHKKPPLNQEASWRDSVNGTLSNYHQEFYYWLNKGSTVTVYYNLGESKKLESVYLALIQNNQEDLQAYYDKPNAVTKPLHDGHDVLKFEAKKDADYAFSLFTYNPDVVTVDLDFHFHSREYSTAGAFQRSSLKTDPKLSLSFFRSTYGLLQGPRYDTGDVDGWEVRLSYGIRWSSVLLIFGFVTLVYSVAKSMITISVHERDPSRAEYAPLVPPPQETQAVAPSLPPPPVPSAPTLPDSIPEEGSAFLKDKERDTQSNVAEDKLCSVCLDASKDSFFVPCGHRATCYTCGLRIWQQDPPNCPICRQRIGELKMIYDV